MFNALSTTYKALVLALIGFTSYSVADTSSKLLSAHYSVYQIIAGVALVILILCVLLAGKMGGWQKTFATNKRRIHLARGITNSIISVFLILALSKLPLATVYSILFTSPFIATLMAIPVFKERVSFHGWVSIIGGFIGVLLVFRPGVIAFDPDLIWALMSAGFIAVMFMLSRALKNEETALSLAFFPAVANFVFMTPLAIFYFEPIALAHIPLFLLSGFGVFGGMLGIAMAFQTGKTSIVSPFHYSQIIWALLAGYFIFGDVPDAWAMAGTSVIVASGLYLLFMERAPKAKAAKAAKAA
jgi:drug/metabolite transporter (DMT)-like permease